MKKMPENSSKHYPLTHAQKRIYYDEKKYSGTSWANNAFAIRYKHELDFERLSRAINIAIKKNDGLRLRIIEFDFEHGPLQYVSPYKEITIDYLDFSGPDSESQMRVWLERITKKTFQLIDSDLFFFAYIKFNEIESGYYLKLHHLVSDGWTCFLLFLEINEIYEALEAGKSIDESSNPLIFNIFMTSRSTLRPNSLKKTGISGTTSCCRFRKQQTSHLKEVIPLILNRITLFFASRLVYGQ